jgi:hypothetical protein
MSKYSDEEIIEEFKNFDKDKFSLVVATVSKEHIPLTNYSPFVKLDNDYFICVSSNLPHFKNMIETRKAHILIIEDESKASHIYARKRLYFNATCKLVEKEEPIFKLFDERYGDSLSFLRSMKDFKILRLSPLERSLVLGFGAAYKMDEEGNLRHKTIQHK